MKTIRPKAAGEAESLDGNKKQTYALAILLLSHCATGLKATLCFTLGANEP
ncbi:hypothetical protein D3C84_969020 [compost metagenome]